MASSRGKTRGVHFNELTRDLPWNIESELWWVITISQYIMSKEVKIVLIDKLPNFNKKNDIRVIVFDIYNSQIWCIQIDNLE